MSVSTAYGLKRSYPAYYLRGLEALWKENDGRLDLDAECESVSEEMKWKELMKSGSASCVRVIEEVKNLKWLIDNYDGTQVEREVVKEACLKAKAAMNELDFKMFPNKIR